MRLTICNVFTIAMAPNGGVFYFYPVSPGEALRAITKVSWDDVTQAVGHEQTAALASASLEGAGGDPGLVRFNRVSVRFTESTEMLICQYVGPRLPEGATTLPEGAELVWYIGRYLAPMSSK